MERRRIAKVAVDKTAFSFDKLFSYAVPQGMEPVPGGRVLVPFGRGNKPRQGMVFSLEPDSGEETLKPLLKVIDREPLLDQNLIQVVRFLVSHTFCTYYDAVRAALPNGINFQVAPVYSLTKPIGEIDAEALSEQEGLLVQFLKNPRSENEVADFLQCEDKARRQEALNRLMEQGVAQKTDELKRKVGDQSIRMVRVAEGFEPGEKLSKKQAEVMNLLAQTGTASVREVCYFCGVTEAVLKNLQKRGAVAYYDRETYRTPYKNKEAVSGDEIVLSSSQRKVYDGLTGLCRDEHPAVALLHGITGSGKTQIFLKLIQQAVARGKQAVMLVPEISLTPQMVAKFQQTFGSRVAVLHSGLSMGEQLDEWKRMKRGEADIVVGTRSAVFAPLNNIGLIIMDEEGEYSYKSENAPRYHAREVAKLRCVQSSCLLLLASATPSVDSYYHAKKGDYKLFTLNERYKNAKLPDVRIVDLKTVEKAGFQAISQELADELHYNLSHKEQSILLLNRRGYNTFASCVECGQVLTCPNCSVAMTYHKANGYMMCHYCGYAQRPVQTCPSCGSGHVRLSGLGTQRVEDEVRQLFPDARILRMDTDTTYSRYAYEQNFDRFRAGEYDILVGTQMIAKGLNFPDVTLVGVVSADQSLYANDFRCSERTFSLITQVVGRSGRGEKLGRALIQTYTPENPVIQFAARQDYEAFYLDEIESRRALLYPPFCDICAVGFSGDSDDKTRRAAQAFLELLKQAARAMEFSSPLKALGPVPAGVFKVNNKYRYRLVIKCRAQKEFRRLMRAALKEAGNAPEFQKIGLFADVNGEL